MKLFSSSNRFEVLAQTKYNYTSAQADNSTDQIKLHSPIFEKVIISLTYTCSVASELIDADSRSYRSSGDRLKIQKSNPESYRTTVHF